MDHGQLPFTTMLEFAEGARTVANDSTSRFPMRLPAVIPARPPAEDAVFLFEALPFLLSDDLAP